MAELKMMTNCLRFFLKTISGSSPYDKKRPGCCMVCYVGVV